MLDIRVTVEGDKVVISDLARYAREIPHAVDRGLKRAAVGIERAAFDFLSGPGIKKDNIPGGGYPVPVRTGHLRQLLDWLEPGQSKSGPAGTFTAGAHEVVVYDSALYANVIHEGRGSSEKFGPRRYLTDALKKFNEGEGIKGAIEKEIAKEIAS
jgi:hypothetical protein